MSVGGAKELRQWGKKEIKTIWAGGSSRDKENKVCLKKQQQECRAQIPSGGGKRGNSCML